MEHLVLDPRVLSDLIARSGLDPTTWQGADDTALGALFTGAPRLFGVTPRADLGGRGPAEIARVAILTLEVERAGAAAHAHLDERLRCGDQAERRAVLCALPLLAAPERFVDLAVNACRTHETPVFEAIACDNTYPGDHFPDAAFQQMVLKALFIGLPLARVVHLGRRRSPELARMASAYASERRAAGRTVPADVALLVDPFTPNDREAR